MKVDLIKDKTAAEIEQVGNLWLCINFFPDTCTFITLFSMF